METSCRNSKRNRHDQKRHDRNRHCWNQHRLEILRDRIGNNVVRVAILRYGHDMFEESQLFEIHRKNICFTINTNPVIKNRNWKNILQYYSSLSFLFLRVPSYILLNRNPDSCSERLNNIILVIALNWRNMDVPIRHTYQFASINRYIFLTMFFTKICFDKQTKTKFCFSLNKT